MLNDPIKRAIGLGWDEMSAGYQAETRISTDDVHYAPLCAGERELGLMGDVAGKRTLELACGAAQNSIALAKRGADATALDISAAQLGAARALIEREGAEVDLLRGDMERLGMFREGTFDIALSCFGWEFAPSLGECFAECRRVLRRGGLLVVGTVHPLTAFEWDDVERGLWVTDYFNPPVEVWEEPAAGGERPGLTFFRTFQEVFGLLVGAGFRVDEVVEPCPYPAPDMTEDERRRLIPYGGAYWESQYERLSRIPFAIVYKARKVG